jgi:hypothetical protein
LLGFENHVRLAFPASAGGSVNNFAFEAAIYLSGLRAAFYAK